MAILYDFGQTLILYDFAPILEISQRTIIK